MTRIVTAKGTRVTVAVAACYRINVVNRYPVTIMAGHSMGWTVLSRQVRMDLLGCKITAKLPYFIYHNISFLLPRLPKLPTRYSNGPGKLGDLGSNEETVTFPKT